MSIVTRGLITRYPGRKPESFIPVAIILSTFLIASCSSSNDDSADAEQVLNDIEAAIDEVDLPGGTSAPEDDGMAAGGNTVDADGDDLPGLVVEGLNGAAASDVISPWLVYVELFRSDSGPEGNGDALVDLTAYPEDFPVSRHTEFYTPELETCTILEEDDAGVADGDGLLPQISGGESVTINTAAGTFFTMDRQINESTGNVFYETIDGVPGPMPADATLSIPGDVFPTVAAYPLGEPELLVRLSPELDESPAADTLYSWVPGNSSAYARVDFKELDAEGEFIRFLGFCEMVDDGNFELTPDMRDYVTSFETPVEIRYSRVASRVDLIDGIVFYQYSEVSE